MVNHLQVNDSNANDVIAKQMTVLLKDTPQIIFTLQNVTELQIEGCEKTEVIFCGSVLECLPYLHTLVISRCNELKQIIGEDAKNQREPFFPRLKALLITQCNKLKCVFPISNSKMLPKLEALVIIEACMLEQVFQGDSDERAGIPNMKTAVFVELPSLCQEIEFLTVKDCLVKNCPKLSLSSSLQSFHDILNSIEGTIYDIFCTVRIGFALVLRNNITCLKNHDYNYLKNIQESKCCYSLFIKERSK